MLRMYLFHFIKNYLCNNINLPSIVPNNVPNFILLLYQIILLYLDTIETYCGSCKKNIANKNCSARRTKRNRLMLVINCAVCSNKNPGSSTTKR